MSVVVENELYLREISLEEENLVENDLCSRMIAKPGLTLGHPYPCLVPSTYLRSQQFASHSLTAKQFLQLLGEIDFCLVSEADCESHEIPKVAQRVPTSDRKKAIRKAWGNSCITPTNKVETLEISVFNAAMTPSKGIMLTNDVLLVLEDGAGRVSAALEELAEIYDRDGDLEEHIMVERDLVVQLNMDLSGDPAKGIKSFLAYNRDAKKITQGTTLAVENGLLSVLEDDIELSYDNPLSRTWIVKELYEKFPIHGSIVEFLPWQFEGKKATCSSFDGRGNAASILTTLKDLEKQGDLRRSGLSVKELPKAIDFAFRCWFKMCPNARQDARGPNDYHFTSTLAIKVMLLTGLRAYAFCGSDERKVTKMLEAVIAQHFQSYKHEHYLNAKAKKMNPDRFWTQSKQFADPSTFNSGAANTQIVVRNLRTCIEIVLRELS